MKTFILHPVYSHINKVVKHFYDFSPSVDSIHESFIEDGQYCIANTQLDGYYGDSILKIDVKYILEHDLFAQAVKERENEFKAKELILLKAQIDAKQKHKEDEKYFSEKMIPIFSEFIKLDKNLYISGKTVRYGDKESGNTANQAVKVVSYENNEMVFFTTCGISIVAELATQMKNYFEFIKN